MSFDQAPTIVIMMKLMILALFVLLNLATAKSLAPGKLLELEYSQRVVHGRYQSGDEIGGITFFSQDDDYLATRQHIRW